jgi:hypothetical protein
VGLKPAAKHPPRRLQTTADLLRLQRLMMHAVVRPLTAGDRLQPKWIDGRPMDEVASEFIKPNDRLTAFERLEIYNRVYWFRLIEAASEDCPGLRALLGERKFGKLISPVLSGLRRSRLTAKRFRYPLRSRWLGLAPEASSWVCSPTSRSLRSTFRRMST